MSKENENQEFNLIDLNITREEDQLKFNEVLKEHVHVNVGSSNNFNNFSNFNNSNSLNLEQDRSKDKKFKHSGKQFLISKNVDLHIGIKSHFYTWLKACKLVEYEDFIYTKRAGKVDILFTDEAFKDIKNVFNLSMRLAGRTEKPEKSDDKEEKNALPKDLSRDITNRSITPEDASRLIASELNTNVDEVIFVQAENFKLNQSTNDLVKDQISLRDRFTKLIDDQKDEGKKEPEVSSNSKQENNQELNSLSSRDDLANKFNQLKKEFDELRAKIECVNEKESSVLGTWKETQNKITLKQGEIDNVVNETHKLTKTLALDYTKLEKNTTSIVNDLTGKYQHLVQVFDKVADLKESVFQANQLALVAKYNSQYAIGLLESQTQFFVDFFNKAINSLVVENPSLSIAKCQVKAKEQNCLFVYPNYWTINGFLKEKKLDKHIIWKYALSQKERVLYKTDKDPQLPYRNALATLASEKSKELHLPEKETLVYTQTKGWDNQKLYHKDVLEAALPALYQSYEELRSNNPDHTKYINLKKYTARELANQSQDDVNATPVLPVNKASVNETRNINFLDLTEMTDEF